MTAYLSRARARHDDGDAGLTLIEMLVSLLILVAVLTAVGGLVVNGLRTQTTFERTDQATGMTQAILTQARQAPFAELGYYTSDGYAPGDATIPVAKATDTGPGTPLTEAKVNLGATRPAGTKAFTEHVQHTTRDNVAYRVTTHVTWVAGADGADSNAKRITVIAQWAPQGTPLTGACTSPGTRCAVQSFVRTPETSDVDPLTGLAPQDTCLGSNLIVCEAYARPGRVLDGATMATVADTPQQTRPVDLYLRTSQAAKSVSATWTLYRPNGTPLRTVTTALTKGEAGTHWSTQIDPDATAGGGYKGDVRPGRVTVEFTVTWPDNSTAPAITREVGWSYQPDRGAEDVGATIVGSPAWCTVAGGTPVRVRVTGHSVGFGPGVKDSAAKDTVEVAFTTTNSGVTRTQVVPATLDPATVAPQHTVEHGVVTHGWVNAEWTVPAPATTNCDAKTATVLVHRAVDQTTTPVTVRLP